MAHSGTLDRCYHDLQHRQEPFRSNSGPRQKSDAAKLVSLVVISVCRVGCSSIGQLRCEQSIISSDLCFRGIIRCGVFRGSLRKAFISALEIAVNNRNQDASSRI